jgi:uncharacterized protein YfiM (DUF2279 family)
MLLSHAALAQSDSTKREALADTSRLTPVLLQPADGEFPYSKKKVRTVAIANAGIYGASMAGLYAAWYKNYPQGKFHVFNDIAEWQQVDKVGHVYSAYTMGKFSMELWRHTGIERKKRIWIGGISGAAYQTVIEILDGFSSEWGWSWADFGANILGSAALVSQELAWNEQRIQLKTSFHRKSYADPLLEQRSDLLFGESTAERSLKDYNAQTYWVSVNLRSFFPSSSIPRWLQASVGYGAEGMFGGRENIGRDKQGNITFYRPDIKRYRQWYLAPDIDLTKIKTKKKGIRLALFVLNSLKFPAPSLGYYNHSFHWNWLLF